MNASPEGSAVPFHLFGSAHLVALAAIALLGLWILRRPPREHPGALAWSLAVLLLLQEAAKQYVFVDIGGERIAESLPLAFCRMNEFLCVIVLLLRSHRVFEVAYFWATTGSVVALLTPDLSVDFPDIRFVLFFLGHGLTVLAVLYAIAAYRFQLRLKSVYFALTVTAVYTLVVAALNLLLDTNHLFLRAKPEGTSVMDFFGPWPWYVFANAVLAVVLCLIAYAPFPLVRRFKRTRRG